MLYGEEPLTPEENREINRKATLTLVVIFLSCVCLALTVGLSLWACSPQYKIPQDDLNFADGIGRAELSKFLIHYQKLYDQQRPPTPEEFGYWTAKYEEIKMLYEWIKSKITTENLDVGSIKTILSEFLKVVI
ncbi:MAG TPA: hypothetical protein ENH82_19090 [bacterium]|nr:hypothetical protein [bacterium]